ncbi:hypothetical protein ACLQ2P_41605 [Actinomadura citrea]|uniref:hypothetical protein n=1 Tax=Actinomadura citrea TaxID=46158 RepID=UPI003CE45C59
MAGRRGEEPPQTELTEGAERQLPAVFAAAPTLDGAAEREGLTVSMQVEITVKGEGDEEYPTSRFAVATLHGTLRAEFIDQVVSGRFADAVRTVFSTYWPAPDGVEIHRVRKIDW